MNVSNDVDNSFGGSSGSPKYTKHRNATNIFGKQNRIKKQNIVNNLRAFSNLLNINPILYANNIYAGPNMRKHKIALNQLSKTIVKSNAAETKINNITFKKKITKSNKNVPNQ